MLSNDSDGQILVPLHDSVGSNEIARLRFIQSLEIPTFENTKKVNFYDTLAMLCNQVVRFSHDRTRVQKEKNKLDAIKKFKMRFTAATGQVADGKATEDIYNDMMMKAMYEYQIDYDILLERMP